MHYPIFNSIINKIQTELQNRDIKTQNFRVWTDKTINAIGLDISIDLSKVSDHVKALIIHLDWDRFREINLARQLEGMQNHPMLKSGKATNFVVVPRIDVEVNWVFNTDLIYDSINNRKGQARVEAASRWMDSVNQKIRNVIHGDDVITRWHVEVEGDSEGRYLAVMSLISYLDYELSGTTDLNDIHRFVGRRLQQILVRTNKIILMADKSFADAAA
ncbi:MAG: hypothetical protein ACNA8K_09420 [Cyclonatronaceae bacterium]